MGDRANIKIKSSEGEMFFYSHWSGSELPITLQNALKRKVRWGDDIYLNRIIFSEMIKDSVMDETGYGLSTFVGDGDDRIVTVNTDNQTVTFYGKEYTFSEYIELPANTLSW